MELWITDIYL